MIGTEERRARRTIRRRALLVALGDWLDKHARSSYLCRQADLALAGNMNSARLMLRECGRRHYSKAERRIVRWYLLAMDLSL